MNDRNEDVPQVLTLAGERWVVLPETVYRRLVAEFESADEVALPEYPPADEHGHYPAIEYSRTSLARKIIRRRRAAGLTQADLARRAKVRPETLNRLERAKVTASVATVSKIVRALEAAGA